MKALRIIFDYYGQKYLAYAPVDSIDPLVEMPLADQAAQLRRNCYCCDMAKVDIELCDVYMERELRELEKQAELWPTYPKQEYVCIGDGATVVCEETGIEVYQNTAYVAEMYHTPWDGGNIMYFANIFAYDCYVGSIYSKDFAYFTCDICGRVTCEQNPSNGWHIQHRWMENGKVCDKCFQEHMLKNGLDYSEIFRTRELTGSFFSEDELISAGYVLHEHFSSFLVGHGMSGYSNPDKFFAQLADHPELNGKKLIINYEHMAIGGMGGYISLWYK